MIFGIIRKNEHNFCTFYKSSTASIIGIYFFEGTITRFMTCLVSKIDYFQVLSMVQSIFIRLGEGGGGGAGGTEKKVTAILRRSSSRGRGTPEVKIASVPVPAFTCFIESF